MPILLTSICVNYCFGHFLTQKKSKKLLFVGVAFNLLFLGYFKYTNFVFENLNLLMQGGFAVQEIALPLGISFFTFTQTAYLVDVYRGETKEYSKSDYLLFVTIFPHLIAGPILYHKDMIPQFSLAENYRVNYKNFTYGFLWFLIGLFKKVIIADKLAIWANMAFNNVDKLTLMDAWTGSLAYTLQLYFDFSGYSEMAIGLGLLFNYNLPVNFNYPYRACSIIDFWRRWHMTLSAFLKNYLYIPLGGNRGGHHMRNIMCTMLLGGLWHGAGWTFVAWGGLHGVFICINHLWRKTGIQLPRFFSWLLTFNAVNLAWIFFRSNSIQDAYSFIHTMVDVNRWVVPFSKKIYTFLNLPFENKNLMLFTASDFLNLCLLLILSMLAIKVKYTEKLNVWLTAVPCAIIFIYLIMRLGQVTEFLYFQF